MQLDIDDIRILFAALTTVLEGREQVWVKMKRDDLDRAQSLLQEMEYEIEAAQEDEEAEIEEDEEDGWDDDDEEDEGYTMDEIKW